MKDWGKLPLNEQLTAFVGAVERNELMMEVLTRAAKLNLPNWFLTGGCLPQTVWNAMLNLPPNYGIVDYDLFYCDVTDISYEAEDVVITAGAEMFGDLPTAVEIRNQGRVHLWYPEKYGVPYPQCLSTEAAIDLFAYRLGVRVDDHGELHVYAPGGVTDVLNLVVRPNPAVVPRELYELKTERWQTVWPQLAVVSWPA